MKKSILILVFTGLSEPVFAQDTTELATQYVNLPEVQGMITEMFSPTAMGEQIAASLPPNMALSDEKKTEIGVVMSEAMNGLRPSLEEVMISSSATTFSADELQALIDFYTSEHGAAVMTKMTPFMSNVMAQLQPEMQALQVELGPKIAEILQN